MADREKEPEKKGSEKDFKIIYQELKENPFQRFNEAFALTSIIPLLVFFYVLITELFNIDILVGRIGLILVLTICVSVVGYYVSYMAIRKVLKHVLFYAAAAKHNDELKSMFVAAVSHELKNPIAILKSNLFNLIQGLVGKLNTEQSKVLKVCYDILQRMTRLTVGLLDIYKIEAGMVELEVKECELVGMLDEQLREFEAQIEQKRMKLIKKIPKGSLIVWLDKDKVFQIMHNLIGNAVKYTPEEGTVAVTMSPADEFVRFECRDTGNGIPEDKLYTIFDKFERVDRSKEGTGLGLAIAKDLIELQGGRIWVESHVGEGTTFTVILPRDIRGRKGKKKRA